jgi:hypothetical protein
VSSGISFDIEAVERKRKTLYLEGHLLDGDDIRQHFFCRVGPDYVVLTAPYSDQGREMADSITAALGPPSREPSTRCGGGCRGDKGAPGLVTSYSWDLEDDDRGSPRQRVASALGLDDGEWP